MRLPTRSLVVLSAVGVLALSGCGDDGADAAGENSAAAGPTQSETPTDDAHDNHDDHGDHGDDATDDSGDGGAVEVEIEIENGSTTPAGKRITVDPGQTIRLEVDSDMADELHLHADPEQSFEVKATNDQEFEFALDTPGVYELESHETGNQVISIQVQP